MKDFVEAFSNREIALLLWISALLGLALIKAPKEIFQIFKILFSKVFLPFYSVFLIYFIGVIYMLQHIMIWNNSLYKDFIFWFFTSAIVSFFKASNVNSWANLSNMVFYVFSWSIVVEFLIDSYNFTLGFEIIFTAFLAFLTVLFAYASNYKEKPDYVTVAKFLNIVLSAAGLALIIFTINQLIINYDKILNFSSLKSFLFAPIFTLLFSPFIIFTVFYIKYEKIFSPLNRYQFIDKKRRVKIKYSIIKNCNFNFKYIENAHEILLWRKKELSENNDIGAYFKNAVKIQVDKNIYEDY